MNLENWKWKMQYLINRLGYTESLGKKAVEQRSLDDVIDYSVVK